MSTIPGEGSWADAGLVPPDSSQVQDPSRSTVPVRPEDQPRAPKPLLRDEGLTGRVVREGEATGPGTEDGGEHEPDEPRPDRDDRAAEGDVLEDYEPAPASPSSDADAPEADVAEQAQEVPHDDDAYPAP